MHAAHLLQLADRILDGAALTGAELAEIAEIDDSRAEELIPAAQRIRSFHFGSTVHLCAILNAKSGRCSEDCAFCSQSVHAQTDAPTYQLAPVEAIREAAGLAQRGFIHRFSVVTSGKALPLAEVRRVAAAFAGLDDKQGTRYCASLGVLGREELDLLRAAGVSRYHHNLETARSHYPEICSTHAYDERVACIRAAQAAQLSVCVGGIFGIGETDAQVVELAAALRELDVDSVPVNFLMPIEGTPIVKWQIRPITPQRALKIIALLRMALPDKDILVCGGRVGSLGNLHPLVFDAGASGVMTGNYLTRRGRTLEQDIRLVERLGYSLRARHLPARSGEPVQPSARVADGRQLQEKLADDP